MLKRIIGKWRARAEALNLERLDDRLLADIGLRRDEIHARVVGRGWLALHEIVVRPACADVVSDDRQAERGAGFARVLVSSPFKLSN